MQVKNMKIGSFCDTHTHTDNSPDGNHNTMYLCESAVAKGIRALAFTDHCEVDVYKRDHYDMVVRQSYFDICKAIDAYSGDLLILKGIELAQPHYAPETAAEILGAQKYDFVIGSLHNLRNQLDFYFIPSFEGLDLDSMMGEYFDELIGLCEWGNFDSLAHLTYPIRYFFERSQIRYDVSKFSDKIDTVFSLLAEKEIALEINTKGLRSPIHELCPDAAMLKRFRELGGKRVTVGSDAHFAEDLGAGIREAEEAALAAGFRTKFIYENRQPVELAIEH